MPGIGTGLGIIQKSSPLISFGTIVDLDYSMLKYCMIVAPNSPYIDFEILKTHNKYWLIGETYRRKEENPLYLLLYPEMKNDPEVIKFLNELYELLLYSKTYDILKDGTTTEMLNVVNEFRKSGDIIPTILCYNETQERILKENTSTQNLKTILLDEAIQNRNRYSQFYFEYLSEFEPFLGLTGKTYYVSSKGMNLNENNDDLKSNDIVDQILKSKSVINIFDLYRFELIGNYITI